MYRLRLAILLVTLPGSVEWLSPSSAAKAEPPTLQNIEQSLDSLRRTAGFTRFTLIEKRKWFKGAMNRLADPPRPSDVPPFLPQSDVELESRRAMIFDFSRGRHWGKGSSCNWDVRKDAEGKQVFIPYLSHSETAFDGVESSTLTPKGAMHAVEVGDRVKVPVEFQRRRVANGPQVSRVDFPRLPLYLCEGCLLAPSQSITPHEVIPRFEPKEWTLAGTIREGSLDLPIIVSRPDEYGITHEFTLRPDLGFVARRFVRYVNGSPRHVLDIEYQPAESGRPTLKGWKAQEYSTAGILECETNYTVESFSRPPRIADSTFTVNPPSGLIAFDYNKKDFYITGFESLRFATLFEANTYVSQQGRRWPWIAGAAVAVLLLTIASLLVRRRWKVGVHVT